MMVAGAFVDYYDISTLRPLLLGTWFVELLSPNPSPRAWLRN